MFKSTVALVCATTAAILLAAAAPSHEGELGSTHQTKEEAKNTSPAVAAIALPTDCFGCLASSGTPTGSGATGLTITYNTGDTESGICDEIDLSCEELFPCELFVELTVVNNTGSEIYITTPAANIIVDNNNTFDGLIKFGDEGEVDCGDVENQIVIESDLGTTVWSLNLECGECEFF